jgi:uncharacterized protein
MKQTKPQAHNPFQVMVKPVGASCNLNCAYCYYLSKNRLYPQDSPRMSEELLDEFTRQYIHSQPGHKITFSWQGGEPTLMGLPFFRLAVELQKKYRRSGTRIHNSLQTNGTLLTNEWGQFFRENKFLIGISLDGPACYHDVYRRDRGDRPTFSKTLKGISILNENKVQFNILTCVHAANVDHPLEVYRFLRDEISARFIQFIPIVERDNTSGYQEGNKVTKRSVTGLQYGKFLIEVFEEWVHRDVGKIFVQIFDVALGLWSGRKSGLCVFDETCGSALALEHNGDLYSCDHYVEPRCFLGNILEINLLDLALSERQIRFGQDKRQSLPRYCMECKVRFACNGGCPKNRVLLTPSGEDGLNYLCDGYKAFFEHIDRQMNIMVYLLRNNRAPAEIMDILTR